LLESYIDLIEGGEGEIVEKKSRFIAQIKRVVTEEEAYGFIEKIKKKHYNARHNCFAFSIGGEMPLLRFSDDGEPQGTAGKPILEVITNSGVHNICIVVTRYFGGTLLGTGGLVRAYTDAAKAGLANSKTKLLQRIFPATVRTSYTDMGKLQYIFSTNDIRIVNTEFTDEVVYDIELPADIKDRLVGEITDATSSRAVIDLGDEMFG
jgi:uncharacterized YigZ family protein